MAPSWIVPSLDEFEDCGAGLRLVGKVPAIDELALERSEEALAHSIVVAITDGLRPDPMDPHGRPHAGKAASRPEFDRGILGEFKWSSEW